MANPKTPERIDIASDGIGHLLADKNFVVPINQRSYAWGEDQVREFFTDIAGAIDNGDPEYFLGSIVVSTGENQKLEVADGQQRLATVSILLGAIRDFFLANGDEGRAKAVEQKYLKDEDIRSLYIEPKLTLSIDDNEFFKRCVLLRPDDPLRMAAEETKDSHRNIQLATKLAAEHVANIVSPYKYDHQVLRLADWIDYLTLSVRVILVQVLDEGMAYVIFETLNDRGADLSKSDLVKNFLFGKSRERHQDAQQCWAAMIGALETVGDSSLAATYIRHLWISMHGPTREKDLYKQIKANIKSKQAAVDFASALAENAVRYAALLNSEHEMWSDYGSATRGRIATLHQLRMEQLRPLLLAVMKRFEPSETKKAIRLFVCWAVRFLIVGGHGGGVLERHYGQRAVGVNKGEIKTAAALARAMAEAVPPDAEFEAAFSTARVSQTHLARYYLRALEQYAADDPEPEFVPNKEESVINLEHILPQNPTKAWSKVTEEEALGLYKRIGNMVLLKQRVNTKIGNAPFEEKRPYLKQSGYILTRGAATYNSWNARSINDRQRKLAALAVKAWPLSVQG